MVDFRHNKSQFLEYIARIGNNLPQMIVCSIKGVIFDYGIARKFNSAIKSNKHIYEISISDSVFKTGFLFKQSPLNLVLDGILSMGLDYIILSHCQFKACFNSDTIKYISRDGLKSLRISETTISSSSVDIIAQGILSNEGIVSVNLSDCSMNDTGLTFLSNAIAKHKSLKSFDVSSSAHNKFFRSSDKLANNFGRMSVDYFFNVMKDQRSITSLNFSGNKVIDVSCLVQFVQVNNTIAELNLSCCGISDIDDLFCALKNQNSIKLLNFSGNNITNADKLVEFLQVNTIIAELDLSGCHMSNVDINRILQILISNNTIVYLELDGNGEFNDACGKTLLDVLRKNRTLKYFGLATHNDDLSEKCIEEILIEMEKREDLELNLHPHIDGRYRGL